MSLTDNTRVVIYDRNVFIIKGTGVNLSKPFSSLLRTQQNKLGFGNFFQVTVIGQEPSNVGIRQG